jgi:hypothetical protein
MLSANSIITGVPCIFSMPEDFVTTDFAPISSVVQLDGILKYSGISLALPVWLSS